MKYRHVNNGIHGDSKVHIDMLRHNRNGYLLAALFITMVTKKKIRHVKVQWKMQHHLYLRTALWITVLMVVT